MNSKVYYGEYSLQHWIALILSGNITLPLNIKGALFGKNPR